MLADKQVPVLGLTNSTITSQADLQTAFQLLCKEYPRYASLGYPFHNMAAHTEALPTREGI